MITSMNSLPAAGIKSLFLSESMQLRLCGAGGGTVAIKMRIYRAMFFFFFRFGPRDSSDEGAADDRRQVPQPGDPTPQTGLLLPPVRGP